MRWDMNCFWVKVNAFIKQSEKEGILGRGNTMERNFRQWKRIYLWNWEKSMLAGTEDMQDKEKKKWEDSESRRKGILKTSLKFLK